MINQQLVLLIESLTKSEKRYFKINASITKTNKSLIELFDLMEKKEFNPDILIKNLGLKSKSNLSVVETRLQNLIMKHLRNFHSNNTINIELKNLLIEVEILYNKRLFKNCAKTILKAKKLATKYEQHLPLLDILKWESYIEKEQGKYLVKSQKILKDISLQENNILKDYTRLIDFRSHTINLLLLSKNKIVEQFNLEIKNYDRLIADNHFELKEEYSLDEKITLLNFLGMYFMVKADFKSCLSKYNLLINLLESSDRKNILNSNEYFTALNNLLLSQVMNNNFNDYEVTVKKIYSQFNNNQAYKSLLFGVTKCYELGIYCEIGETDKAIKIIPDIINSLKKDEFKINEINKLYFYLNIAIAYFFNKNYSKAIFWFNTFLNDYSIKRNDVKSNIYYYAHIINLVIHFEAKNYDSINYLYKESINNLKKIRAINKFDNKILSFIKDKSNNGFKSKKDEQIAFKELKTLLTKLSENSENQAALQFFDFFAWIDSHLTNKEMASIVKEKRLGFS